MTFQAEVMRGDEYVERERIKRIGFLRIDVEGAEYRVLEGFSNKVAAGRWTAFSSSTARFRFRRE